MFGEPPAHGKEALICGWHEHQMCRVSNARFIAVEACSGSPVTARGFVRVAYGHGRLLAVEHLEDPGLVHLQALRLQLEPLL